MPVMKTPALIFFLIGSLLAAAADLRLGIVGTDTSHAVAFARILNDSSAPNYVPGARIVAAYKGGSPDLKPSIERVEGFAKALAEKWNVEIVPDIPTTQSKPASRRRGK